MRGRFPATAKLAVALHIAALTCVAIAYSLRDSNEIEGAYFNRSVSAPSDPVLAFGEEPTIFWFVAAAVFLVAGTLLLLRAVLYRAKD